MFQMQNDGCKCPAGFRGGSVKTCEGMSFLQNNSLFKMLHNWCLFSVVLILWYEIQRCIFFVLWLNWIQLQALINPFQKLHASVVSKM
jgi:hypothetical protein